jgi:endoglucanase
MSEIISGILNFFITTMKNFPKHILFLVIIGISTITRINAQLTDTTGTFLVNQVGYLPDGNKIALLKTNASKFSIIDVQSKKVVFSGSTGQPQYWKFSGDTVRSADFSPFKKPGKYRLCIEGNSSCSYEFEINKSVYTDVAKAAIKAFYFNRCSFEITKEFGGKWARPAGHPDTAVIVHESAASKERPAGTIISSPGGWYDAGDYNKYIVNSGITMYTLLLFYQMYPEYCHSLNTNIPESKNDIPDVVDEILFNLKWMLSMQDPNDGGVYHKLTNKGFDGIVMPDKAVAPRYVVMKCTSAALDFAAVTAMASRLFEHSKNPELAALSRSCRDAARKAMAWAKANPSVYYKQPTDVHTGGYDDYHLDDEFFWANAELALLNNQNEQINLNGIQSLTLSVPGWPQVDFLGVISLALSDKPDFKEMKHACVKRITAFADSLAEVTKASPYKMSISHFGWGSNSDIVNRDLLELVAYKITGDKKYLSAVQGDVDYILGKNATGYCFVTGFGSKHAMNIHHRISGADGIAEPEPGFMPGGPNETGQFDCGPKAYSSKFPAKSYVDALCSYASNEIAINWNAPLFFVLGSMDAIGEKK